MILSALRLFKSLSRYHYRTIFITILLPVVGSPMIAYFGPEGLPLQVTLYIAAFFVWSVIAVLAVASMLTKDRSEAAQLVAQQVEELSCQISGLKKGHEDLRLDLRQQVDDLEETVRATLKEDLGVILPPRPVSVRAEAILGTASLSAAIGTVTGGSKLARLRRWCRRATYWLWEVVYGRPE